jgi:uncharacterized protein (DUF1800 family)
MQQQQNHLLWRAGFGPTPIMQYQSTVFEPEKLWDTLWRSAEKTPEPLLVGKNLAEGLANGLGQLMAAEQIKNEDEKKQTRQAMLVKSRQNISSLNLMWLNEMVTSPAQLREKMSLFWHGHFACRNLNSFFQQQLLHAIRENALGSFGDLLRAVSKTPAMLQFLNNQQNRKLSPNENFAREVMELFTLGRGHYTETDVKEAARAFTGWGFEASGNFVFRPRQHDDGTKTVLGKSGKFDGDDVLNILLAQPATAHFVTEKIFRFFVNDQPNARHVNWLSKRFFASNYSIGSLLRDIFTSKWFYEPANLGNHIKSPIELLVGLRRQLPMTIGNETMQLQYQRVLGQMLMYPPNVAGWPGGQNWIDASSLLFRMRLPQALANAEALNIKAKADDDTDMGRTPASADATGRALRAGRPMASIDWTSVVAAFQTVERSALYDQLARWVLQSQTLPPKSTVERHVKHHNREAYIASTVVALMSCPEYQLC